MRTGRLLPVAAALLLLALVFVFALRFLGDETDVIRRQTEGGGPFAVERPAPRARRPGAEATAERGEEAESAPTPAASGAETGEVESNLVLRVIAAPSMRPVAGARVRFADRPAADLIWDFDPGDPALGLPTSLRKRDTRFEASTPDLDALAPRSLQTDADGEVRLPLGEGDAYIQADHEGRRSPAVQMARDERGKASDQLHVLILSALPELRVRCLDAEGKPVAGIRLHLSGESGGSSFHVHFGPTDQEGLGSVVIDGRLDVESLGSLRVQALIAAREPPEIEIPVDRLTEDRIHEFRLPGAGALRVLLKAGDGRPWSHLTQLTAFCRVNGRLERTLVAQTSTGLAELRPVLPGCPLLIVADVIDRSHERVETDFAGLARVDEAGEIRLDFPNPRPLIRGVLRADPGSRIAVSLLRAEVAEPGKGGDPIEWIPEPGLQVEADGRFTLILSRSSAGLPHRIRIVSLRGKGTGREMSGPGASFEVAAFDGTIDVGEIRLEQPPVIAAGRVRDRDGKPVEGIRVNLYRPAGGVGLAAATTPITGYVAQSDAEGCFEIRGPALDGIVFALPSARRRRDADGAPFAPPFTAIDIVLD